MAEWCFQDGDDSVAIGVAGTVVENESTKTGMRTYAVSCLSMTASLHP